MRSAPQSLAVLLRPGEREALRGDVGQGNVEEIDVITRGGNYGWRIMEGYRCYKPKTGCKKTGLKLPVAAYTHSNGRCSVTGGYVYRGSAVPALVGTYVYGDFCSGEIFGLNNGTASVLLTRPCRSPPSARTPRGSCSSPTWTAASTRWPRNSRAARRHRLRDQRRQT